LGSTLVNPQEEILEEEHDIAPVWFQFQQSIPLVATRWSIYGFRFTFDDQDIQPGIGLTRLP
jgi:hypothetical protein